MCKLPGGFTIFCDRALPGEHLRARITAAKQMLAQAIKVATLKEHDHATEAPCVHYGDGCGGCSMQNLAYFAQLAAKERQVGIMHATSPLYTEDISSLSILNPLFG